MNFLLILCKKMRQIMIDDKKTAPKLYIVKYLCIFDRIVNYCQ